MQTRLPGRCVARRMLIDGLLVEAHGYQTLPSINPANGQVIGYAPDGTVGDAERAVAAARRAFDDSNWSTDVGLRLRCLEQLHRALAEHREELRSLTIAEVGTTHRLTEGAHLDAPMDLIRDCADLLGAHPMTEDLGCRNSNGQRHHRWVEKEAAGVVGAITACTQPMQLALTTLGPALAAGCTVVLKATPEASLITLALGELIATCTDIPRGVVNVVSALDPAVDTALTLSRDIDVVAFAGPTASGRRIMAEASKTVKRVLLDHGGAPAAIILDDADFSECAARATHLVTIDASQRCSLGARLLVPRRRHDEIVGLLEHSFAAVRCGDPADPETEIGPLISDKLRDDVDGMVKRAVAAGATLVCGGKLVRPGYFYEPTLLTDVDPDSEIARLEVSGPVLLVIAYDDDDDAARIANRSTGGSCAVFGSHDRAVKVARRVRSSTVSINGGMCSRFDTRAGIGVGELDRFMESKTFAAVIA